MGVIFNSDNGVVVLTHCRRVRYGFSPLTLPPNDFTVAYRTRNTTLWVRPGLFDHWVFTAAAATDVCRRARAYNIHVEQKPSSTLFKRVSVTTYQGEVLRLTKVSRSEMGAYLCIGSNGVPPSVSKRITVSVHCK